MKKNIIKIIKGSIIGVFIFIFMLFAFSSTIINSAIFKRFIEEEIFIATSVPIKIRGGLELSFLGMRPAIAIYDVALDDKLVLYKLEISPVFSKDTDKAPLKVFMSAEGLRTRNINFGNYSSVVYIYKTGMSMPSIKGDVGSAKLDGKLEYLNDKFKLKLNFSNVPYSKISKDMNGRFKAKIDIAGRGSYFDKVRRNLKGNMLFIGGKGYTKYRTVNLWTTDFLKILFSGKKDLMKFDCIIADFSFDKGIAHNNSLFLDAKDILIIGEGNVNIYDKTIDIKLTTKSKSTDLVDLAHSIRIKGMLKNPSIELDTNGATKNVDEDVLTAMNSTALLLPTFENLQKGKSLCDNYLEQRKIK